MQRYAFFCPACGELELTENAPPGEGNAACLYRGAAARWCPVDAAGEFEPGGCATPAPSFVKTMVRQMSVAMSKP